ncbi:UDP-Glycosyltransferase/glycogen phosphorylase [Hesseltinella vesiculosa]|uniref:UDP-Glycosyltransferase/glycogen phosphorylase n=1 Tax=Hesseltinella vesiculosa TaxID=101127 RepID=A0A1X2G2B4_9FUNG|nr:UDP-Glycosyltransferase/glycogen phosphorylase [Hesseltinella vesiculosa]
MGGMGMVLTALATEQQKTGYANVNVVLPFYSFLQKKQKGVKLIRYADLVIHIPREDVQTQLSPRSPVNASIAQSTASANVAAMAMELEASEAPLAPPSPPSFATSILSASSSSLPSDPSSIHETLEFRVTKMIYNFGSPPPAVNFTTWYLDDRGSNVTLPAGRRRPILKHEKLSVYLIGPANKAPFDKAFQARNVVDIYSTHKDLPQEWKDQYFVKATAAFLSFQANTAGHETSLFAPTHDPLSPAGVDVVHIHGATNAYLAHYLQDPLLWNTAAPRPSVVYTMHDYLDELQYTNTVRNVLTFDPSPPTNAPVLGKRMFMSSMAIDLADIVTFVSRSMASQIIQGELDFYLKELVMDSLLQKAQSHQFFGITNGLDFSHADPFHSKRLTRAKIVFPLSSLSPSEHSLEEAPVAGDTVAHQKDRAKRWLVRKGFLQPQDKNRPLVLFVGRFQYNKGLASFPSAIEAFVRHNMTFVIVGQPNNFPLDKVLAWQKQYPEHVRLVTTQQAQKSWLIYARAAADAVFVPSQTESFGLVAGEGLLFGGPVLSTGVGGLREFLVDRPITRLPLATPIDPIEHNAYLYDAFDRDSMIRAIDDLATDLIFLRKQKEAREAFIHHMIQSALALQWAQDSALAKGPVYDYLRTYVLAMKHHSQHNSLVSKKVSI